jgi:hypothetical protein
MRTLAVVLFGQAATRLQDDHVQLLEVESGLAFRRCRGGKGMNDLNAISGLAPKPDAEHTYTFDVKAFFSVTVKAKTRAEALKIVDSMDGAQVTVNDEVNNESIDVILAFDGEHVLTEKDGEDVE